MEVEENDKPQSEMPCGTDTLMLMIKTSFLQAHRPFWAEVIKLKQKLRFMIGLRQDRS
jgi:hypothetical protein